MASKENAPSDSFKSPPADPHRRKSIIGYFDQMTIKLQGSKSTTAESSKRRSIVAVLTPASNSLLRGTSSRGWPPSLRGSKKTAQDSGSSSGQAGLTLEMSDLYLTHGDNWGRDPTVSDMPVDMTDEFEVVRNILEETQEVVVKLKNGGEEVVYGSNMKARAGLDLDETLKICMEIFGGAKDIKYSSRTEDYQAKLEAFVRKDRENMDQVVIRSRREVVQHAAAFQHLIDNFARQDRPLSENLIRATHGILMKGISGENAGFLGTRSIAGIYRAGDAFAGSHRFPKASQISAAMKSMVDDLAKDLKIATKDGLLDPFMLAAKYCDRFVNIHPFRDGNGRMCRLILNIILIKYAGIVINVGEQGHDRDHYLLVAVESAESSGHPGALGQLVLKESQNTLKRIRDALLKRRK